MSSILVPIPSEKLEAVWPSVAPWINRACESMNGRMNALDWYESIKSRDNQLWVSARDGVIEAVTVTEILCYPHKKYLHINIVVGHDRANWQRFMREMETFARAKGCSGIQSLARPGWKRILKDWDASHVFLEKEF
jgi:hypothetical protein